MRPSASSGVDGGEDRGAALAGRPVSEGADLGGRTRLASSVGGERAASEAAAEHFALTVGGDHFDLLKSRKAYHFDLPAQTRTQDSLGPPRSPSKMVRRRQSLVAGRMNACCPGSIPRPPPNITATRDAIQRAAWASVPATPRLGSPLGWRRRRFLPAAAQPSTSA